MGDEKIKKKFSMASAIAKELSGIFKGVSIVPEILQLKTELKQLVRKNIKDPYGVLLQVLERVIDNNDLLISERSDNLHSALILIIEQILKTESSLIEFVRKVDQQYGVNFQERPHFQNKGDLAHPEDPYTHESVRESLEGLADFFKK